MVFTCRVPAARPTSPAVSRRALLAAVAGGALAVTGAGCGPEQGATGDARPAELTRVLAGAVGLAAAYRASSQAQPSLAAQLAPLLAEHETHIAALRAALGQPSADATPATPVGAVSPDPAGALAQLRAAEQAGRADAAAACVSAPDRYAALLGSIAACRATHLEALS
jgi:hypothetical protein